MTAKGVGCHVGPSGSGRCGRGATPGAVPVAGRLGRLGGDTRRLGLGALLRGRRLVGGAGLGRLLAGHGTILGRRCGLDGLLGRTGDEG